MEILFVVVCAFVWAFFAYKEKLGYYQKMAVKAVLAYGAVLAFGIALLAMVVTIGGVIATFNEDTVEKRLDSYAWYCNNGDFDSLAMSMHYDQSYEEEFDYLWEQVDMYDTYNQYQIYMKAAEVSETGKQEYYLEKAEECKRILQKICAESTFEENVLYAEYYGTLVWE